MSEKMKRRLQKLESTNPLPYLTVEPPQDYCHNPQARAEFARAVGLAPEVLERARNNVLAWVRSGEMRFNEFLRKYQSHKDAG